MNDDARRPPDRAGRILIVEDDPLLREFTTEQLSVAGFEVHACADGRAALQVLEREEFDAVLSDVRMPDMDGLGLLRAVRERDLDIPIVLMTGGPSLESAIEAVEHGALQYLIKPLSPRTLLETSHRAVKLGALARLRRAALKSSGLDLLAGDRAGVEASFAGAIQGLWMAYQPIVRASDGAVFAYEALLRTSHPSFLTPGTMLATAERLGRLPTLGAAVRAAVARSVEAGVLPGLVFVNLHPLDLVDDALLDPDQPLSRCASRVVLEITERAGLDGVHGVGDRVRSLRSLGYRIALDDLGAGYAGLTSFATLSPEFVKLDRALIHDLDRHAVKQKLVDSIARVCRDLEIRVIAEGIETENERTHASRAGCELLQGYLFGPATPRPSASAADGER